jgi:DNA gyrase/topoisomerase IV subunit A
VVERGVLVVKLWWIAGESWEVDGQFSGSKNMPLFPDLFLRDSHFGNLVQPLFLSVSENGYGKRTDVDQYRLQSRGGKGVINMKTTPKIGKVSSINLVDETSELIVISRFGKIIRIDTNPSAPPAAAPRASSSSIFEPQDKVAAS